MHLTDIPRSTLTFTAAFAAAISFLACIVVANYVTTEHGMIAVGFGLTATAGTYFAGLTFVLRDTTQDAFGRLATLGLILAGAGLSLAIAPHFTDEAFLPPGVTATSIAIASGVAPECTPFGTRCAPAPSVPVRDTEEGRPVQGCMACATYRAEDRACPNHRVPAPLSPTPVPKEDR